MLPTISTPSGRAGYWIYLDGISVTKGDGSEVQVFDRPRTQAVLLDSGTSVSSLPTDLFNEALKAFPETTPLTTGPVILLYRARPVA